MHRGASEQAVSRSKRVEHGGAGRYRIAAFSVLRAQTQDHMTETGGTSLNDVGVVAIGRNEDQRLVRCLDSLPETIRKAVYVDSGSTDDSVANARARGWRWWSWTCPGRSPRPGPGTRASSG